MNHNRLSVRGSGDDWGFLRRARAVVGQPVGQGSCVLDDTAALTPVACFVAARFPPVFCERAVHRRVKGADSHAPVSLWVKVSGGAQRRWQNDGGRTINSAFSCPRFFCHYKRPPRRRRRDRGAPGIGQRLHGKFTGAFDSLNEWDLSQCGQTIQKVFRRYGNRNPG